MKKYKADIIIIGAGISGITASIELLNNTDNKIILIDRDSKNRMGGLAKESFGGIFFVNTSTQKRIGIRDNPELALKDWLSFAEFNENDYWQKKWAEKYVYSCKENVYKWLRKNGIKFFPIVHWVERGLEKQGNSVPRFHMVWGTGQGLVLKLIKVLNHHPKRDNLGILFDHKVEDFIITNGHVSGVFGTTEDSNINFEADAPIVIIASGGIGGNLQMIKDHWDEELGNPPDIILNGSHKYALGELHKKVEQLNGRVVKLNRMWNYAAGVHHHKPDKPNHGLSLVPPKSALWLDATGKRIGPTPLITGFDTRFLIKQVRKTGYQYSWQVMNWRIAVKELAISGAEFNPAMRDKKIFRFLKDVLLGNEKLVEELASRNPDFVTANSVEELCEKMNQMDNDPIVNMEILQTSIKNYDRCMDKGENYLKDEQLRRIAELRKYFGDKARTCWLQKIDDKKAFPLIAIKEHILSRKSLGGIETDLDCRVIKKGSRDDIIPGLYAIGEAAGFGGGGMHGKRSLEGTFLGGCILTGREVSKLA